jgi:hypothetical protein
METGYIPLCTKVRYRGYEYETDTACSRALGTIGIIGNGPHDGFFVKTADLEEIGQTPAK